MDIAYRAGTKARFDQSTQCRILSIEAYPADLVLQASAGWLRLVVRLTVVHAIQVRGNIIGIGKLTTLHGFDYVIS